MRVKLLDTVGAIYNALGDSQKSREMLEESIRLRETKLPTDNLALADSLSKLGNSEEWLGDSDGARKLHERALSRYRAILPESDHRLADERYYLSQALFRLDRLPEAESYLREAAALYTRNKGPNDEETFLALGELSYVLQAEGKYAEAYQTERAVLAAERSTRRPDNPVICDAWETLGTAAHFIGRLDEQEKDEREALSVCLQTYDSAHPEVLRARYELGNALRYRGKYDEAEFQLRTALAGYRKLYGETHSKVAGAEEALGQLFREGGRVVEAREYGEAAVQVQTKIHPDSLEVVRDLGSLAQTDYAAGNLLQASQEIEKANEILHRRFPDGRNYRLITTESVAAEMRAAQGNLSAAEELAHHALESARANFPEGVLDIAQAESALGWIYHLEGRTAEGCPLLRSALASAESTYGPRHPVTAQVAIRLAACDERAKRQGEADELIGKDGAILLVSRDGIYRIEQRWLKTHPSATHRGKNLATDTQHPQ